MNSYERPGFTISTKQRPMGILHIGVTFLAIIIFPTIGFLGANKYLGTQEKTPAVLGVSTTKVEQEKDLNKTEFTIAGQNINLNLFKNNPQLIIAGGAIFGVLSLLIALTLIKNTLSNKPNAK